MFITFEGIDGAGKTTILDGLCQQLTDKNVPFCRTREPGGSSLGLALREKILYAAEKLDSRSELFLFLADRAQHVAEVILPALKSKMLVLCDRYFDSTLAYQGYAQGLDLEELRFLNAIATQNLLPDLTFLFDLDVKISLKRVHGRQSNAGEIAYDRFDHETMLFHERVRAGYLEEAKLNQNRYVKIDASQPLEDVLANCSQILWERLAQ